MIVKDFRATQKRLLKSRFIKRYGINYKFYPRNFKKIQKEIDSWIDVNYMSMYEDGRMDIHVPKNAEKTLPVIIWIHGGGYAGGDKIRASVYTKTLASHGFAVINMNYHLAPEAKYPTPIIQFYEMINYLIGNYEHYNIDLSNVFIGGDSAGAQIASQIGAIETNKKLSNAMQINPILGNSLRGLLLCCGLYNMDTVIETKFPFMDKYLYWYTDSIDIKAYKYADEMSTVKNITRKYPKAFITCGLSDPFYKQAQELETALSSKKVEYTFIHCKGNHECQYNLRFKTARNTLNSMVDFIRNNVKE